MFASVMKHAHDKNTLEFLQQLTKSLQLLAKLEGIDYIYGILRYIMSTYDVAKPDFVTTVRKNLPFIDEEKVMTIVEQCRREGRQEGMQIGKQKGKLEALEIFATNLLKQNIPDDKISTFTGLSILEIKVLKKKLNIKTVN